MQLGANNNLTLSEAIIATTIISFEQVVSLI